jgi:hypothetical protein
VGVQPRGRAGWGPDRTRRMRREGRRTLIMSGMRGCTGGTTRLDGLDGGGMKECRMWIRDSGCGL